MDFPIPKPIVLIRQVDNLFGQFDVFCLSGTATMRTASYLYHLTGSPFTDVILTDKVIRHSAFFRQAHHFSVPLGYFALTSLSMRLSSVRSATIFFNSLFSRSRSFSRRTSEVSMPPYFCRHR